MKGRNRPISLKTDVIKSRNRSKGKSASKDRTGNGLPSTKAGKSRGDSTSRTREAGKSIGKSEPGGAEIEGNDSDAYTEGATSDVEMGRKLRKTNSQDRYPPPTTHTYAPPPHHHQPYPPATVRARSNSRRAHSLDARPHHGAAPPRAGERTGAGAPPYYAYAPPPTAHQPATYAPPPPEGYYSSYGYSNGYAPSSQQYGQPPSTSDRYNAIPSSHPHSHQQIPSLTHAQSDSRSQSPSVNSEITSTIPSPTSSASPPLFYNSTHQKSLAPIAAYPIPTPYAQSPLSSSTTRLHSRPPSPTGDEQQLRPDDSRRDSMTLAPIIGPGASRSVENYERGGGGDVRGRGRERIVLPPIDRVAFAIPAQLPPILYDQYSRRPIGVGEGSSSGSASGSPDGLRSPPSKSTAGLPWEEHRRGRSETRHSNGSGGGLSSTKGKEREIDEIDELDEEDELNSPIAYEERERIAGAAGTMVGVENGLGELRDVDRGNSIGRGMNGVLSRGREQVEDSRSRSSGGGGSRDRGRAAIGGENRVRSLSRIPLDHSPHHHNGSAKRSASITSSTGGGRSATSIEVENQKLRARVSELTFLNGLLLEKLQSLDLAEKEDAQVVEMEEG